MFRDSKVTVELIKSDGTQEKVTVYVWDRGENTWYFRRTNGSWITPFEFRHRYTWAEGFGGFNTHFKVAYTDKLDLIADILKGNTSLLNSISKEDYNAWKGGVIKL